jgi:hypothetical protein
MDVSTTAAETKPDTNTPAPVSAPTAINIPLEPLVEAAKAEMTSGAPFANAKNVTP